MAATLRQEINIIDATISGAGNAPFGIVQLDTAQYSGTTTYYFEIVGKITSGSTTISLRRNGTTTDDATITLTGSTTNARFRSASFTPPAGQTEYFAFKASAVVGSFIAARIIVIQSDATSITSTETQIEIGNNESAKVNTTAAALTNPKYWKYNAAQWNGTTTFFVEMTWTMTGTGSGTVKLQQDGGSDNFTFADLTPIVTSGTAASATRVRVPFTPTDGRNYQITTVNSSSMGSLSISNAKIIVDSADGAIIGNSTFVGSANSIVEGGTGAESFQAQAQSFKLRSTATITGIKLYLAKTATPTDTVSVDIVSSLGGTSLANATISSSTLTTTAVLYTLTFTSSVSLTAATTYYIQVTRSPDTNDATNFLQFAIFPLSQTPSFGTSWTRSNNVWSDNGAGGNIHGYQLIGVGGISLIEAQYLLANTSYGGSTGLKSFDTLYDPAEWDAGTGSITYLHEGNGVASGTGNIKLQSDPHGTPTDITNSPITGVIQREQGAGGMTMPGASATLDVNVTATGTLNAARILARWVFAAASGTTYNETYTEAITVSDVLTRSTIKLLTQAMTVTDTLLKTTQRTLSQAITVTDTFIGGILHATTLSDAITVTSSLLRAPTKQLTEAITNSDTFARLSTFQRTLAESITTTATLLKATLRLLVEAITNTDTIAEQQAQAAGPNSPATTVNDATVGTIAWVNPNNAQASDAVYATANTTASGTFLTNYLKATNYGFSISSTATITGILVEVQETGQPTGAILKDSAVQIVKSDGSIGTTNLATAASLTPASESFHSYGSSSTLWGETWAPSDINSSNFGVAVSNSLNIGTNGSITSSIDYIRITVYYIGGSGTTYTPTYTEAITNTDTLFKSSQRSLLDSITLTSTFTKSTGRSLTDSITVSDTVLKAATRVLSDAVTASDTFLRATTRVLNDAITATDTALKSTARTLSQAFTLTDTFIGSILHASTFTDAITTTATFTSLLQHFKTLTETFTVSDTLLRSIGLVFTEAISTLDSLIRATSRTLSETFSLTDTFAGVKVTAKLLTDALTLTDTLLKSAARTLTESITLADTFLKATTRTLTETITTSDVLAALKATIRTLTEAFSVTDTFFYSLVRTLTEPITTSDVFIAAVQHFKTLTDALTTTDTLLKATTKLLSEAVTGTATFVKATTRTLIEALTNTDTLLRSTVRTLTDALTNSDTLLTVRGRFTTLLEAISATDSFLRSTTRSLLETFSLTDSVVRSTARTLSEALTATANVVAATLAKAFVGTETIALTDSFVRATTRVLTETFSLLDTALKSTARTLSDAITNTASVLKTPNKVLSQSVTVSDALARLLSYGRIFTESVVLTDSLTRRLNGIIIIWSHVQKSTSATWTKAQKGASAIWTHISRN